MLRILVCLAFLAMGTNALGIGLNLEAGLNGNYGIVGVEGYGPVSDHVRIHAGTGITSGGPVVGLGARFVTAGNECYLFKHCEQRYFAGITTSYLNGGTLVDKENGETREFEVPRTTFININVGDVTTFFESLDMGLHLGCRFALRNQGELKQTSGSESAKSKDEIEAGITDGPQVSVSAGVVF